MSSASLRDTPAVLADPAVPGSHARRTDPSAPHRLPRGTPRCEELLYSSRLLRAEARRRCGPFAGYTITLRDALHYSLSQLASAAGSIHEPARPRDLVTLGTGVGGDTSEEFAYDALNRLL
ncbi:MAG: hypothetical protein K8T90_08400 [Planctomycetes bacterium]|nr:hypothetical protein [Planctomycetota bacterium]